MDALKAIGLCALLIAPPQAPQPCTSVAQVASPEIDRWQRLIAQAAQRFGIPQDWIRAVRARESAGLTTLNGRLITSRAGAMGLMQLMPSTWSDMRARYALGNDPFDPRDNIIAGAAYLKEMFDRYGFPDLFAAYHAGPGWLDAVLAGEKLLPEATGTYLNSIVPGAEIRPSRVENRSPHVSKGGSESLFFVRTNHEKHSAADTNTPLAAPNPPRDEHSLFVPLGLPAPNPAR